MLRKLPIWNKNAIFFSPSVACGDSSLIRGSLERIEITERQIGIQLLAMPSTLSTTPVI